MGWGLDLSLHFLERRFSQHLSSIFRITQSVCDTNFQIIPDIFWSGIQPNLSLLRFIFKWGGVHFGPRLIMDPFFVIMCIHMYVWYDGFGLFLSELVWGVLCTQIWWDGEWSGNIRTTILNGIFFKNMDLFWVWVQKKVIYFIQNIRRKKCSKV